MKRRSAPIKGIEKLIEPVDKRFFRAVKSGDKKQISSAFEGVYREYVKLVAFVVGGFIADRETVKEIVNDVFLKLFNHAESVTGSVKYYLTVSAKNAAINRLSHDFGEKLLPEDAAKNRKTSDSYNEVLIDLKRYLTDVEVKIVLMHAVEGYTFKEIAEKTGSNANTVATVYRRAIKKYKKEASGDE